MWKKLQSLQLAKHELSFSELWVFYIPGTMLGTWTSVHHSNLTAMAWKGYYHYHSWVVSAPVALRGPLHWATLDKISKDQLVTKKEKHFPSLSTWTVPLLSPSPPLVSSFFSSLSHSFPFLFILLVGKSVWAIMPFRNTKVAKLIPKLTSHLSTGGFFL